MRDTPRYVCYCFEVDKATIVSAIKQHDLRDEDEIGSYTRAGCGCGTCKPDLRAILAELGVLPVPRASNLKPFPWLDPEELEPFID
ncbi:MAG: (2Fe-2S)-binding protein [Planctomycetes bacterium]|nr:(2Fe-2S)-binding protein [Planctomycetota bacterium]